MVLLVQLFHCHVGNEYCQKPHSVRSRILLAEPVDLVPDFSEFLRQGQYLDAVVVVLP